MAFSSHCTPIWKFNGISTTIINKVTWKCIWCCPRAQRCVTSPGFGVKLCSGAWKRGPDSHVGTFSLWPFDRFRKSIPFTNLWCQFSGLYTLTRVKIFVYIWFVGKHIQMFHLSLIARCIQINRSIIQIYRYNAYNLSRQHWKCEWIQQYISERIGWKLIFSSDKRNFLHIYSHHRSVLWCWSNTNAQLYIYIIINVSYEFKHRY